MYNSSKVIEISTLKSFLLVFGAYTFSYCLGLTFHEIGHALSYTILGLSNFRIYVHPFTLSHVSISYIPLTVMPFTGSMGPLFNLLCSSIVTLSVWRKRNPKLLPLLMCAATAFMAEGVAIIIDIISLPLLTDWGKVMIIGGVSPIIMGIISALFITIGSIIFLLLLPLENVFPNDSYWKRLLISLGYGLYFTISVIYVSFFDPSVLFNRIIALISATGFTVLLMSLYKPAFPYLDRISHTETSRVSWAAIGIALGAALVIISIDLIFFS